MEQQEAVKLSIIIPAYNEEKYIGDCLNSVFHQSVDSSHYEVIVMVASNTNDRTVEICRSFGAKVVMSAPTGTSTIAAARADGFIQAKGHILACTDADTNPDVHWVEAILDILGNPTNQNVVALTGPCVAKKTDSFMQRFGYWLGFFIYRIVGAVEGNVYFPGQNFAVTRDAYEHVGGFDRSLGTAEDTNLALRLNKIGKVKWDKRMRVFTSARRTQEGYLKSFLRYTRAFFLMRMHKPTPNFVHYR